MTEPNKELPKYAPIIEAKDKEIERLNKEISGHRLMQEEYCETIEAKDKRIAELEADLKKVMGLLKERVWEDEYDRHYSIFNDDEDAQKSADKEWAEFCKPHGIDLGGE